MRMPSGSGSRLRSRRLRDNRQRRCGSNPLRTPPGPHPVDGTPEFSRPNASEVKRTVGGTVATNPVRTRRRTSSVASSAPMRCGSVQEWLAAEFCVLMCADFFGANEFNVRRFSAGSRSCTSCGSLHPRLAPLGTSHAGVIACVHQCGLPASLRAMRARCAPRARPLPEPDPYSSS